MDYGQEGVRKQLINYCTDKGIKYIHIAKQLDLAKSTISHFILGDRDMRTKNFEKVVKLLQDVKYLE
ncbi:helix-turn-helix domain-containing protein [Clostridium arbusti]|jgi:predicted transcriptional regulator|uniref:helix-turn-helix domain-containing protein n=1 Tax=Clostridium arbusti TaxID=1137848 RepID=UPI000289DF40|nr:helix-turn-helix domain-containing protein [Clostridium arbusti]